MPRLPQPGGDSGNWGDILNEYLGVELNSDGSLKIRTDSTVAPLVAGKVPQANLGAGSASGSNFLRGDGLWAVPSGTGSSNATTSAPGLVQLAGDLGGPGTTATAPVISDGAITNTKIADGAVNTSALAAGSVTSNEIANGAITNADISASAAIAKTKLDSGSQTSMAKADTSLQISSNLSDVSSPSTARANLGLGNVDNTADAAKPVSSAQQSALDLKANLASPSLTGTPSAPTATAGTSNSQIATTAYADASSAAAITTDALHVLKAGDTMTGTLTGRSLEPSTTSTYNLGTTNYYSQGRVQRLYFNPTAYLDGVASGTANIGAGSLGILATSGSATHSLTLGSTSTGMALYNTADQTTNFERVYMGWTSNVFSIRNQQSGSGTLRDIAIGNQSRGLTVAGVATINGFFQFASSSASAVPWIAVSGSQAATAGVQTGVSVAPTINQTTTAGYTALLVNPTETTVGSGAKLLVDLQVSSTSKFSVDNTGTTTLSDGANIVTGTTNGTMIGTSTSQKVAFFGASPVVQQAATAEIGSALAALGLRASGANYPVTTSGAVSLNGNVTASAINNLTGNMRYGYVARTASVTLTNSGTSTGALYQICDATSGTINITLPASAAVGMTFTIKKTDSSANAVTVVGTIDGVTNYLLNNQNDWVTVASTGTSGVWYITASSKVAGTTTTRTNSTASSATPAINTDTTDQFNITALATDITSMSASLTGTPADGQKLRVRIKDNGTARAISWGVSFQNSGTATLLATTIANKTHMVGFVYDSAVAKWVCMAVDTAGY